jgi:hypothetical protein
MTGRTRIWQVAAAVFVFINVAGIAYGAAMRDGAHAAAHVAILFAGYLVWRMPWGRRQDLPLAKPVDERQLEYLQQSVDAIALEVERIGEKQRFSDKLRVERGENPPLKKE